MAELPALHPESIALLERLKDEKMKPLVEVTPAEARRQREMFAKKYSTPVVDFEGTTRNVSICISDRKLPVRIYQPVSYPSSVRPALLVYFHGGGWTVGSIETHHSACASLAQLSSSAVASVGYRLAPEHKFPAAVEDALASVEWFADGNNRRLVGLPEDMNVGVGGDSGGGRLAAVVAHELHGKCRISFQVLIYPGVDATDSTDSHKRYENGPILTKETIAKFRSYFATEQCHTTNPRLSPILYKTFEEQPPCVLIIAECDPYHDESLAYGKRLEDAGVKVKVLILPGLIHAFFSNPGICKESCRTAYSFIAEFLKEHEQRV